MIQANELRVGNWVVWGAHGPCTVTELKKSGKIKVDIHKADSIKLGWLNYLGGGDSFDPIPLTDEILDSVGLAKKKKDDNWYLGYSGFFIFKNESGLDQQFSNDMDAYIFNVGGPEGYGTFVSIAEIHNVHQLQNLYFALTGEELKIEL